MFLLSFQSSDSIWLDSSIGPGNELAGVACTRSPLNAGPKPSIRHLAAQFSCKCHGVIASTNSQHVPGFHAFSRALLQVSTVPHLVATITTLNSAT